MGAVTILQVPYDSGYRDFRMGRGPGQLLAGGLPERLEARGLDVEVVTVECDADGPVIEPAATFSLLRVMARSVAAAAGAGRTPLVLAGNCISSLATLAGLGASGSVGAVWLDAHGDLNTPETSPSGFLDGMALACLTGRCWSTLAAGIPGFRPLDRERVLLAGARDLDPGEREYLSGSGLRHLTPRELAEGDPALAAALDALRERADTVYLHVDIDVIDAAVARFNRYAAPGGLTVDQVGRIVDAVGERFTIAAAALTAWDPACDDRGLGVALGVLERIASRL